jgi:hypothetical protein
METLLDRCQEPLIHQLLRCSVVKPSQARRGCKERHTDTPVRSAARSTQRARKDMRRVLVR